MAAIQRADARSQKMAILTVIAVLIGGAVLGTVFQGWITVVSGMPLDTAIASLTTAFNWSVGIGTVVLGAAGCHFWWRGNRVRQTRRFPHPGALVIRDTVVLEGQAAVSRGTVLQILGVTLIVCAVSVAVMSWWILRKLMSFHG
jgi:hypothetical protein